MIYLMNIYNILYHIHPPWSGLSDKPLLYYPTNFMFFSSPFFSSLFLLKGIGGGARMKEEEEEGEVEEEELVVDASQRYLLNTA